MWLTGGTKFEPIARRHMAARANRPELSFANKTGSWCLRDVLGRQNSGDGTQGPRLPAQLRQHQAEGTGMAFTPPR